MQTTIELVLSIYVDDNGTLFCLIYKNRTVEKSLPIDLFYLTYEDEKLLEKRLTCFSVI
jgi:hypothetical protein